MPRIALFGIDCSFTNIVLERLANEHIPIVALVLPGPSSVGGAIPARTHGVPSTIKLNLARPPTVADAAAKHAIPAFHVGGLKHQLTEEFAHDLKADLLVCACFNKLIPRPIRRAFPLGGLNIHPSYLPKHRGPDPAFWTFHNGTGESGVTIHCMSSRFDAGPIVIQQGITLADGTTEAEFDQITANVAADLLLNCLPSIQRQIEEAEDQDESCASYAPWPATADYRLDVRRSARSTYNFFHGVKSRGVPFTITCGSTVLRVTDVLSYVDSGSESDVERGPGTLLVRFNPGFLIVRTSNGWSEAD